MNEALLCIGSNIDKESNMKYCQRILIQTFDSIQFSDTLVTAPYGERYNNDFLNQLAFIKTTKDMNEVAKLLKSIERQLGRIPEDKPLGIVKIDVDLVIWNSTVLRADDLGRSYIQGLLPDFAANIHSEFLSSIIR